MSVDFSRQLITFDNLKTARADFRRSLEERGLLSRTPVGNSLRSLMVEAI